ncbi:MAG: hypothetical protein KDB27_29560, partial [Planctomycetales bacterium]|nr:hypothetical protein [Planctomycetales bacterium]
MPSAVGEKTTASRDTPIDLRVLGETLCSIPASAATEREALQQLTQIIRKLTAATSASYFPTDAAASIVEGGVVTSGTLREEIETQTWKLASLSIGERSVQTARVSEGGKEFILSVPVVRPRHAVESICVVVSSQDPSRVLPGIVQILQIVAAFAAQWRGKVGLHDVHEQLVLYQRLTELLNEAVHLPTEDQFAEHITENIRHEFTAVAAAYVEAKRDGLRIMSISPARKFDRQSEFSKSIVA